GSDLSKEAVLQIVDPVIKSHFRPEFINRLDEILPFLPLQEKDMEKIVLIQLDRVKKRLDERDISLDYSPQVLAYLAKEGYDPYFGARPLKRLIQQTVVNELSQAILKGEIKNDDKIELNFVEKNNKIVFEAKKIEQTETLIKPS
ncbi:MAG: ATP-dependent Clp protease ATP-binding subunit, partial [Simkania sp.]|nr:ATP-dependent Clp protease ATP-binding subunit [Simkania sp.]